MIIPIEIPICTAPVSIEPEASNLPAKSWNIEECPVSLIGRVNVIA
jgi:hypothetical protein